MTDVNELFSKDPLKLTDENVDQIIIEMRKRRHLYIAGPAKAKSAPTALTDGQKKAGQLKIELKL